MATRGMLHCGRKPGSIDASKTWTKGLTCSSPPSNLDKGAERQLTPFNPLLVCPFPPLTAQ